MLLWYYWLVTSKAKDSTEEDKQKLKHQPGRLFDDAFKLSLYGKGLIGIFETLGGILLLIVKPDQVDRLANWLTQADLSRDPHDFIANNILKTAHHLTGASLIFGALYLLSHGIVKIVLVVEVLRDHLWAYIALIVVTAIFVIYQVYRLTYHVTFGMSFLTVFDLVIIYLTWREYGKHKLIHEGKLKEAKSK